MDSTLATYLRTLRTPSAAPEEGRVDWEKTDLFGNKTHARVEWWAGRLEVQGLGEQGQWRLVLCRNNQGWEVSEKHGAVVGGTPLACVRWAGRQVVDLGQGAHPIPSWEVPRAGKRGRRP